ncbi:MAG: Crp/Fnr family transcriptional regulator [Clostridiales bacterium]|nr:Crp/Fnr family transcriptional regulator [Clostridiales bacterium]
MTYQEKLKAIRSCSLFKGLSESGLDAAVRSAEETELMTGELLFSDSVRRIGVVVRGSAKAVKPKKEGFVTMSILGYGDVFGAVSVMGGKLPSTEARAVKPMTLLTFTPEAFEWLLKNDFELTKNYCSYLISRIRFLTERVECMAGASASEKLLKYLETNAESGVCHIPFGMDALARAISVSRATLYRALDELEKNGSIARSGHDVRLL